ncbi:hypothetical protein AV530_009229 [Patagioenas fasciata monilis]|uniref:RING-type E3 ubiquitin transferase n=1 Tax=Patagioenas fasciata monilis TaxID=372326 RepID=A0A1V4KMH0_PATFA|nr:hypothetical protein AV530_009229 [Patagioenas fasciata monilis]
MDAWVRFSAQSAAKERLFRAAQYACAVAADALRRSGASAEALARARQLEAHLSLGRKLVRLGSWAEALEAAKRGIHQPDAVLRFCLTLGHLNRALFCACDNAVWAARAGLLPALDQDKWSQRSFRYYLFALVLNLSRDAYELRQIFAGFFANSAVPGSQHPFSWSGMLHSNPGDYAWGQSGLDAIVTQLLGQLENTGPPPADKEKISSLPTVPVTQEQVEAGLECPVCKEDYAPAEQVRQLPCNHLFHSSCIVPWLELHDTCPVCRKSLKGEDSTRQTPGGAGSGSDSRAQERWTF